MRAFIDTNVFLYAFLDQDVAKKHVAVECIANAVRERNGFVSLQVVKEFCNVMMKRSVRSAEEISKATELFDRFNMVDDSILLVRNAISLKNRYGLQFFDALMVVAAVAGGCDTILTEDLNDGQVYCGVRAVNPFAHEL